MLVYDLEALSEGAPLDSAKVWAHHVGISHIAGMKHRENTVFGDVILVVAGATRGKAQMISYPDGKLLWSTETAGNNPHCIEILPSGNIAVASSTGGTVRLFKTAALLAGDEAAAQEYVELSLPYAHGVLYDPEERVLWILGGYILAACRIEGEGVEERLIPLEERTLTFPKEHVGGHVLVPDLMDSGRLCISVDHGCFSVDKKTLAYTDLFEGVEGAFHDWVKGLCKNRQGSFCLVVPTGGKGTPWEAMGYRQWCSDTLILYHNDGGKIEIRSYPSENGHAFYKTVAFCGTYL